MEIDELLILKKQETYLGYELTIQFKNISEPHYCNLYLMTLIWEATYNQYTCKEICVYNNDKNRFEEITPCYSSKVIQHIIVTVTNNLNRDNIKRIG